MKTKIISAFFVTLFILISWFAWNAYDYNYGKDAETHCMSTSPYQFFRTKDFCSKFGNNISQ